MLGRLAAAAGVRLDKRARGLECVMTGFGGDLEVGGGGGWAGPKVGEHALSAAEVVAAVQPIEGRGRLCLVALNGSKSPPWPPWTTDALPQQKLEFRARRSRCSSRADSRRC
jgi:hypothetical protein